MAMRTTLNISLPPELGKFIEQRVASDRNSSASKVIRAGLRLLEGREGLRVPSPRLRSPEGQPCQATLAQPRAAVTWHLVETASCSSSITKSLPALPDSMK
jgi:putative addiction module CopG family antidote